LIVHKRHLAHATWAGFTSARNFKHHSPSKAAREFTQLRISCRCQVCKHAKHFVRRVVERFVNRSLIEFSYLRRNLFKAIVPCKVAARNSFLICLTLCLLGECAFFNGRIC
jgi:hypothetical protein